MGKARKRTRTGNKAGVILLILVSAGVCVGIIRALMKPEGDTDPGGNQTQEIDTSALADVTDRPVFSSSLDATPSAVPDLSLPLEIRSGEGWAFTIDGVAQLAAIDGRFERYLPRNGTFLVLLGRVRNYTDKSGCIGGEDFLLRGETQEYPMSPEIVRTVRAIYEIDYPDFVLGQCLDYDKEKASFLVFDVPLSDEVLWLRMGDSELSLGSVSRLVTGRQGLTPAIVPSLTPLPLRSAPKVRACCKICTTGKACGDSCIASNKTCHKPPGCACD